MGAPLSTRPTKLVTPSQYLAFGAIPRRQGLLRTRGSRTKKAWRCKSRLMTTLEMASKSILEVLIIYASRPRIWLRLPIRIALTSRPLLSPLEAAHRDGHQTPAFRRRANGDHVDAAAGSTQAPARTRRLVAYSIQSTDHVTDHHGYGTVMPFRAMQCGQAP